MKKEKIILAYSGGLDTSVILKWLINKGYEVICFVADVGQKDDFEAVKEKALKLGASKVYIEDLKKELVVGYIWQALKWNVLYEGRYLLGTSLARPLISKKQIEIAQKENAQYVSYGSTGKGNDQVRFELSYYALSPNIKVFAPWKDEEFLGEFKGRNDMLDYAQKHKISVKASKSKPYSEDENLMHISHEAGVLEDPFYIPAEEVFNRTVSPQNAPDKEIFLEVYFQKGLPVKVVNQEDGKSFTDPLEIFIYLNELGNKNGIGRLDMVENRFIGVKSRGIYETPGATILWEAHRDIEGLTMDKEMMHLRNGLMPKFSEIVYNGFWFSPEMDFLMSAVDKSQENVEGKVILSIYKGNVRAIARQSERSLYNQELSSMDIEGGFNAIDSKGFISINAIRLKAYKLINDKFNK